MRELLKMRLEQCDKCRNILDENAPMVVPDLGILTDEQVVAVLTYIGERHLDHARC